MIDPEGLRARFRERFGRDATAITFAPGRVNLIGEHIDYHGGPVLPMALERGVSIAWAPRIDGEVHAVGREGYDDVRFRPDAPGAAVAGGHWGNYLKASAAWYFGPDAPARDTAVGVDMRVESDLPEASGLSSSSALSVATGYTLLHAAGRLGDLDDAARRRYAVDFAALEQYVGTKGGGMDQASSVGGIAGHALRIVFDPLDWRAVRLPDSLAVVVAHTGVRAEKSGAVQARYNAIRAGFAEPEIAAHIASERERVDAFVELLEGGVLGDAEFTRIGHLLDASHASLRDRLEVSHETLETLCDAARAAGALGARLTGAGFGGSMVAVTRAGDEGTVRDALRAAQARMPNAVPAFIAKAGDGARVMSTGV